VSDRGAQNKGRRVLTAGVFDREALLARQFPVEPRFWTAEEAVSWARGFGAGLPGELSAFDARFLDERQLHALPAIAVPLCDGEFWQQRLDTGIDWRQIVHAEEVLTLHRPLPLAGRALLSQSIVDLRDRGVGKGASMRQRFSLTDEGFHLPYAELEVTTLLRGNGGFGGPQLDPVRPAPLPERRPDAGIDIRTPAAGDTSFGLPPELLLSAALAVRPGQCMLRGAGSFGLATRAALALVCGNEPQRLLRLGIRFGGVMLSEETMRFELWNVASGQAVFRMRALEREAPVLSHGTLAFVACSERT
jgi:hypothetical protein